MGKRLSREQVLRVLLDWAPFIAVYIVFESLRGVVPSIMLRVDAKTPLLFEEKLFGAPLSLIMYHYRFLPLEIISSIVYALHPVDALILGGILYLYRRKIYYSFITAFTVVSAIGLLVYFIWPVAPPWMVLPGTRIPNYLARLVSVMKGAVYGDPNPFAAMPSLHMALAVLVFYYLWISYSSARVRVLAVFWPCAMFFSIIYTGNHYLLDALVGVLVGLVGIWAGKTYHEWLSGMLGSFAERSRRPARLVGHYLFDPLSHVFPWRRGDMDITDAKNLAINQRHRERSE